MNTTLHSPSRSRLLPPIPHAALLLVVLLALTGCNTDDDATDAAGDPDVLVTTAAGTTEDPATEDVAAEQGGEDPADEPDGSEEAAGGGAGGDVVEITAVDYGFEGVPEEVAAGTELTLQGVPDAEPHELVAFQLDDDDNRTVEELLAADGPPPGTFAGVLVAPPGGAPGIAPDGPVVLDEAGRYLIVCFIPTGTTAEAFAEVIESGGTSEDLPEVGPPHFVQGMVAELTVS